MSLDDFSRKRNELLSQRAAELAASDRPKSAEIRVGDKRKASVTAAARLSFAHDDGEDDDGEGGLDTGRPLAAADIADAASSSSSTSDGSSTKEADELPAKRAKLGKDPTVDTSFLPDQEREKIEQAERQRLAAEWLAKQDAIKGEQIKITYSYWDGAGHRSEVTCRKGDTISAFLEKVRQQWPELRGVSVDNIFYVKEDVIIPHHYTFYDFIINKARGKSGPLFHFDVHDDVRLIGDVRVEKDESHAGKVLPSICSIFLLHVFF